MKRLIWIPIAVCAAAPLAAQQRPAEPAPEEHVHVVRRGDTLWNLARSYYADPLRWPEIFRSNPDVVANPAHIFPADRLRIPSVEGSRASFTMAGTEVDAPTRLFAFGAERGGVDGAAHTVGEAAKAIRAVVSPGELYRAPWLADEQGVVALGRIAERVAPGTTRVNLPSQVQLHARVYLELSGTGTPGVGDQFHLVRPGRSVRPHGRMFQPTGIARVQEVSEGVAVAVVERVYGVILPGDLVLPLPRFAVPSGVDPVPEIGPEGVILAFQYPGILHMTQEVAILDLGSASGIRPGDEFSVFQPRRTRAWGVQPEVEVARLRVVRVDERTSAARVVGLQHPALAHGLAVRRVARMP